MIHNWKLLYPTQEMRELEEKLARLRNLASKPSRIA
jgi:hypothetical protein